MSIPTITLKNSHLWSEIATFNYKDTTYKIRTMLHNDPDARRELQIRRRPDDKMFSTFAYMRLLTSAPFEDDAYKSPFGGFCTEQEAWQFHFSIESYWRADSLSTQMCRLIALMIDRHNWDD